MQISLTGEQKRILTLPLQNPILIKGVAGSGKTTVAIHRAKHLILSNNDLFSATHIGVFSYTKSLVKYVQSLLGDTTFTSKISVTTFHKWAYGFLDNNKFWANHRTLSDKNEIESIISSILLELRRQNPTRAVLLKTGEFFVEEISWLKGRLIFNKQDYIDVKRTGRGTADRVTASDKELIWSVYESYCSKLKEQSLVDFDDYAIESIKIVDSLPSFRYPFSHIVIDEAQDLTAAQLLLLTKIVDPVNNSITIIADAAQRIYKSGFAWSDIGLNVRGGRSVELKQNYRNTKQIAEAALSLLSHDPQNSDFSEHLLPHREGPVPIVKHVNGSASQYSELIKILSKIDLSNETVVFLHRNRRGVENILSSLKQKNFKCINIISSPSEDIKPAGIYGCTMSSIKGLEFDHVIICDLNDDILPYPGGFTDENDELHISTERRLLYTCMTRARKGLILLSTGKPCRYFQEIDHSKVEVHSAHPF